VDLKPVTENETAPAIAGALAVSQQTLI